MRLIPELQDAAPDNWAFETEIGNGERYRFALEYSCVFCHIASRSGGRWQVVVNYRPDSTEDAIFGMEEEKWQNALSLASGVMALYTAAVENTIDSLSSYADLPPDVVDGMPGANATQRSPSNEKGERSS
ncbi:hypothetical protein [Halorussus sp. AFM4]|uniref:hypothetical protein n=1 Tax=Halorussus sp. AFM4 TaxID=3421651 RepID=UPI003EB72E78